MLFEFCYFDNDCGKAKLSPMWENYEKILLKFDCMVLQNAKRCVIINEIKVIKLLFHM